MPPTPGPRPPRPRPRRPRPTPFLGPLTVALLLLFGGATVFAERVGWVTIDLGVFAAIGLLVIGAALILSAFVGQARGLIGLGIVVLVFAWFVSTIDLVWWSGIGDERVEVDDLDDLDDEYRWGIGEFVVDLAGIELAGESRTVAVGLTIGELRVYVPADIGVDVTLDGGIGRVAIGDGGSSINDEGIHVALARTADERTEGILTLDVDLGIGDAEVIVCGGPGAVSCP